MNLHRLEEERKTGLQTPEIVQKYEKRVNSIAAGLARISTLEGTDVSQPQREAIADIHRAIEPLQQAVEVLTRLQQVEISTPAQIEALTAQPRDKNLMLPQLIVIKEPKQLPKQTLLVMDNLHRMAGNRITGTCELTLPSHFIDDAIQPRLTQERFLSEKWPVTEQAIDQYIEEITREGIKRDRTNTETALAQAKKPLATWALITININKSLKELEETQPQTQQQLKSLTEDLYRLLKDENIIGAINSLNQKGDSADIACIRSFKELNRAIYNEHTPKIEIAKAIQNFTLSLKVLNLPIGHLHNLYEYTLLKQNGNNIYTQVLQEEGQLKLLNQIFSAIVGSTTDEARDLFDCLQDSYGTMENKHLLTKTEEIALEFGNSALNNLTDYFTAMEKIVSQARTAIANLERIQKNLIVGMDEITLSYVTKRNYKEIAAWKNYIRARILEQLPSEQQNIDEQKQLALQTVMEILVRDGERIEEAIQRLFVQN